MSLTLMMRVSTKRGSKQGGWFKKRGSYPYMDYGKTVVRNEICKDSQINETNRLKIKEFKITK